MTGIRSARHGDFANIADVLSRTASERPNSVAFTGPGVAREMSWAQLDAEVDRHTRRLVNEGARAGDRIAVQLTAAADFAVAIFAVAKAGAVSVPLSPRLQGDELTVLLRHSGSRFLFAENSAEGDADGIKLLALEQDFDADTSDAELFRPVSDNENLAVISYTSGTTARPRGVMLSHRALLTNIAQVAAIGPNVLLPSDRLLIALPLFHIYGLGPGLLHAADTGSTIVVSKKVDATEVVNICAEYKVTVVLGSPTLYGELSALPGEKLGQGLATVRRLTSGAAPLSAGAATAIWHATGLNIYEGYGLTEAGPVVTSTLVTGRPKVGSVGQPLPGVEIRLTEPDGDAASAPLDETDAIDNFAEDFGGTGVVAIRGDNLFSGYWPDGALGPSDDGWFRTGDVGYLDDDGDLHLVDRAVDLITVNGFTVYPREVEEVIGELSGVAEVAAVGVVNGTLGEVVKAVIVPVSEGSVTESDVIEHCASRLAKYKVPRFVEFVDHLPHSDTGKLRRMHLR